MTGTPAAQVNFEREKTLTASADPGLSLRLRVPPVLHSLQRSLDEYVIMTAVLDVHADFPLPDGGLSLPHDSRLLVHERAVRSAAAVVSDMRSDVDSDAEFREWDRL